MNDQNSTNQNNNLNQSMNLNNNINPNNNLNQNISPNVSFQTPSNSPNVAEQIKQNTVASNQVVPDQEKKPQSLKDLINKNAKNETPKGQETVVAKKDGLFSGMLKQKIKLPNEEFKLDVDKHNIKTPKKLMYEYIVKDQEGEIIKDYFDAYSVAEVNAYLKSEGYTIYSIKTDKYIQTMYGVSFGGNKMAMKDLIFFLTQLSTYIKAGVSLVDSIRILARQYKNKNYKRIFKKLMYSLTMGDSFSEALNKQSETFPKLLINMIKTAEMTGQLPETLDDMADYYTSIENTKKQMINALTYPTIVFVFAIAVIIFIMLYVVPQFTDIYASMGTDVPAFTQMVFNVSNFLQNHAIGILLVIIAILSTYLILYKNVKAVRRASQYVTMHIPVIKDVIIYSEVATFSKTFSSLLANNVFITDSMDILSKLSNNEIYKELIYNTIENLGKGEKVSKAFKNHWAFPIPAYEMLITGEKTGQLPEMMNKVAIYYQNEQENIVTRLKAFIEPILIVFLTVIVGIIVLSIIIPMFSMYESMTKL